MNAAIVALQLLDTLIPLVEHGTAAYLRMIALREEIKGMEGDPTPEMWGAMFDRIEADRAELDRIARS